MNSRTGDSMCLPESDLPRIVVIGGGFAGMALIKRLKNKPVQVVLLDKNNFHQFQPLLYQVATSGIEPDSIVFPFRKQFKRYRNVVFRMAEVSYISPEDRRVETDCGSLDYDYLVIATGSITNFFDMRDVERNAIGMKNIREALDIRSLILENIEKAVISCDPEERDAKTNFAIIGGGATGVEMAGALAEFRRYILPKDYPELDPEIMSIYLIESANRLLMNMSDRSSSSARKYLQKMGVTVLLNTRVLSYDGRDIKTVGGDVLKAATVIWSAGVKGNFPAGISDEDRTGNNRMLVDEYLKVEGYDNIYAIGDIAAIISEDYERGHPMVAQAAIQQGRHLAGNIMAEIKGKTPNKFTYKSKGTLATVGKHKAVADLGRFRFGGFLAWLIWSFVHLFSISGFRNKMLVAINWVWSYFTYEKSNRVITRKLDRKLNTAETEKKKETIVGE